MLIHFIKLENVFQILDNQVSSKIELETVLNGTYNKYHILVILNG